MNEEGPATRLMNRFMNNKVWVKLYGPLANEWLSIREASMEIEPEKTRGYTLNRSVQLCIRELAKNGFLESQEITKTKERISKKGKRGRYTSKCLRHKLNAVKLWSAFLTEKCSLNNQEKDFLHDTLREPGVERILRNRKMEPRGVLTLLISQFAFIANARPDTEDFLKRVGNIATKNLTVSDFLEPKDRDEFVNTLRKKILENKPLANQLSTKIVEANFEIFFTSQDFSTLIMKRIPEDVAYVFSQVLLSIASDKSISRYGRFVKKRIVDTIFRVYRGEIGEEFVKDIESRIKSTPNFIE